MRRLTPVGIALLLALVALRLQGQDARELEAEQARAPGLEEHPLKALMASATSALKPELKGVHPRVYVTGAELDGLRKRARTTHRKMWQKALQSVRALSVEPPAPPAQERRAQNEVGLGIAEAAFVYQIENEPKYLDAAKKYLEAAVSYDTWGYANNKPNVDLAAGHLLYGMGWGYDLLYDDLTEAERARYRDKLARQARLMYEYFEPEPGKKYAYSQNHTYIPIAGLAVAAYALYDEVDDAPQWAALARAIFDRVLATYSQDGYFYEGFEYWIFSMPWLVHWLDAHAHATGEDLFDQPGLRRMHAYVGHSMLPGAGNVFDFGDVWEGPLTRARSGKDWERSHPGGHFSSNYNLLYRQAQRFKDGAAQGVAQWLARLGHVNAEEYWSLIWYDAGLAEIPVSKQPAWHYFQDHEVLYWRSDWSSNATAFAFKCGPPEGHHATPLLQQFPDWRLSSGHAHPDANSFIIFARNRYLTGDSGYAGVPLTAHHNTVLVDGKGQGREGKGHDAWDDVPYGRLDQTRIVEMKVDARGVVVRGDATGAYLRELGLMRFERRLEYAPGSGFTITDMLEADEPRTFTALLHVDDRIMEAGDRRFFVPIDTSGIYVAVVEPAEAQIAIQDNDLTTAGPPGAVDQGEKVVRGQRLAVSTKKAASARIVMKLEPTWRKRKSR